MGSSRSWAADQEEEIDNLHRYYENRDIDSYQEWTGSIWLDAGDDQKNITHCLLGIGTEMGEVQDIFKKPWFTPKRRDYISPSEISEEIGDVMYYLCRLAAIFKIPMSTILSNNKEKLEERYGHGK